MEGNDIEDLGGGSFRTSARCSATAGSISTRWAWSPPAEVPPFFYVEARSTSQPDASASRRRDRRHVQRHAARRAHPGRDRRPRRAPAVAPKPRAPPPGLHLHRQPRGASRAPMSRSWIGSAGSGRRSSCSATESRMTANTPCARGSQNPRPLCSAGDGRRPDAQRRALGASAKARVSRPAHQMMQNVRKMPPISQAVCRSSSPLRSLSRRAFSAKALSASRQAEAMAPASEDFRQKYFPPLPLPLDLQGRGGQGARE